jgi:DNA processing protein
MNVERAAILRLYLTNEIGPVRLKRLIERFGSANAALEAPNEELLSVEGMTPRLAAVIANAPLESDIERELERASKAGVNVVTCADHDYPESLSCLSDRPPVLFIAGKLEPRDNSAIAIVGTRRATAYGRSVSTKFSEYFAQRGLTVVSGLARGIDTDAHEAALAAGGRTIAVLGGGINRLYPPENKKLAKRIAENGAVISEFPMEYEPTRETFPRRNRVISGLSLATVVVEADAKSGALITARTAAEQGKDVFAVPGPIFSKYSNGTHQLLRDGAGLADSPEAVLFALGAFVSEKYEAGAASKPEAAMVLPFGGEPREELIVQAIAAGSLSSSLLRLELLGLVKSLPGKMYSLIR